MHVPHCQRPLDRGRGARAPRVRPDAAVRKRLSHPFLARERRAHVDGAFSIEELGLALQHVSLPLEALRDDLTPVGLHYTLSHFDIPALDSASYRLIVDGSVARRLELSLAELHALPRKTLRVTLECAGNGRAGMAPRYPSMPWTHGAVGNAEWTGTPLRGFLERAGVAKGGADIAFFGADRGFDSGVEHAFARSLKVGEALGEEVLLAWAMNGQPLLPQHGAPLRLVVPGWFGMASVKWLVRIAVLDRAFDGYQQVVGYQYKQHAGDPGLPVRHMKVKSLMAPPGIPDWYTRRRLAQAGEVVIVGRAWSGGGIPVRRVQFGDNGAWQDAELDAPQSKFSWQRWRCQWQAKPGEHELTCRASDAEGAVQPLAPQWNQAGMGNNAVHTIQVTVRERDA